MKYEKNSEIFMDALKRNLPISKNDEQRYFASSYIRQNGNGSKKKDQNLRLAKSSFTHRYFYLPKDMPDTTANNLLSSYVIVSCGNDFMENYYPKLVQQQKTDLSLADFLTKCPQSMLIFFESETEHGLKINYGMPLSIHGFSFYVSIRESLRQQEEKNLENQGIVQITCQQMQKLYQCATDMPLTYNFKLVAPNKDTEIEDNKSFYTIKNLHTDCTLSDNWIMINNTINYWFSRHMQLKYDGNLAAQYKFVIDDSDSFYQKLAQNLTNDLKPDLVSYNPTNGFIDFLQTHILYVKWDENDYDLQYNYFDEKKANDNAKVASYLADCAIKSKLEALTKLYDNNRFTSRFSALIITEEIPVFKPVENIAGQEDSLLVSTPDYNTFAEVDPQERHSLSGIFDAMEFLGKKEKIFVADGQLNVLLGKTNIKNIISKKL